MTVVVIATGVVIIIPINNHDGKYCYYCYNCDIVTSVVIVTATIVLGICYYLCYHVLLLLFWL